MSLWGYDTSWSQGAWVWGMSKVMGTSWEAEEPGRWGVGPSPKPGVRTSLLFCRGAEAPALSLCKSPAKGLGSGRRSRAGRC